MVAVIGHWFSDICIPVSSIYEDAGILTIVPTVSNPELMQNGYEYVFQSITSDKKIANKMCDYAEDKGYKKVVIYYEESSYGRNLANEIERKANQNNIKIIDRISGMVTKEQFEKAHDKWKALDFDAVLMVLNMPEAGVFIKNLRFVNTDVALVTTDAMDVSGIIEELGNASEGMVVFSNQNETDENGNLEEFSKKYSERYDDKYDVWAIQGYESIKLIANSIEMTDSCNPKVLASYLHDMEPIESVFGKINFNELGEIQGRGIYGKMVVDGKFEYIK
jgi:branched-chain amino acid transport system substrate-binding protein